jgi:hypothetical protein
MGIHIHFFMFALNHNLNESQVNGYFEDFKCI